MLDLTHLLPLKRHAESNGITLNSLAVLVAVASGGEDRRTHGEIATLIGTSPASVTSLIDRLVAANCVSSLPSPGDRRCKYVELTPRGRHILDTALKAA